LYLDSYKDEINQQIYLMKILFLSRWFPFPPNNGSKIRVFNLLKSLSANHDVELITFFGDRDAVEDAGIPISRCRLISAVQYREYSSTSPRAIAGYLSPYPRSILDTRSGTMANAIREAINNQGVDLVISSQIDMASYCDCFEGRPAIFDEIEVGTFHQGLAGQLARPERLRRQFTWYKLKNYLRFLLPHFTFCTVASQVEYGLVTSIVPDYPNIEIIPNGIYLDDYRLGADQLESKPNTLIFTGSFSFTANLEAMQWFVEHVLGMIQSQIPDIKVVITGDPCGHQFSDKPAVTQTGMMNDIRPLVAGASVCIAPIQTGGGTRLKILEAMALKTPVVATSKAVEGLNVTHEKNIFIADTPESFSEAIIFLLSHPEVCERIRDEGYKLVQKEYEWSNIANKYDQMISQIK
jgi:glycosyltransferase involved in cell wall biosynthesis